MSPAIMRGWWAVTLIQRFGGALNANIHFHMLFLDGVYIGGSNGRSLRFRGVKAPTSDELIKLTHSIASRVARYHERQGLLERDSHWSLAKVKQSNRRVVDFHRNVFVGSTSEERRFRE